MPLGEDRVKAAVAIGVAVTLYGGALSIIEAAIVVVENLLTMLRRLPFMQAIPDIGLVQYSAPWWSTVLFLGIGAVYIGVALGVAARVFKREA